MEAANSKVSRADRRISTDNEFNVKRSCASGAKVGNGKLDSYGIASVSQPWICCKKCPYEIRRFHNTSTFTFPSGNRGTIATEGRNREVVCEFEIRSRPQPRLNRSLRTPFRGDSIHFETIIACRQTFRENQIN